LIACGAYSGEFTGLLKMIVRVLTTCHTQYTWDRSMCIFLFNRTTLQVFVTYLTGALYVHHLWFYKQQHDNRVRSTQNAFSLPFAAILVNCAPSGEMRNYCTPHIIKENFENILIHRCNYVLLSQVYCIWQVVKTPTIILNNPVYAYNVFAGEISRKVTSWKLCIGGRILLKRIPRLVGREKVHLFFWFKTGTSGWILWARQWTFRFHKMWRIFGHSEKLLASQDRLCYVQLVP